MLIFIKNIMAFYFVEPGTNNYLTVRDSFLVLTEKDSEASDFNMMPAMGRSELHSIFSLGQSAISVKNGSFSIDPLDQGSKDQSMVAIFTSRGTIIVQHGDKCMGKNHNGQVTPVDCNKKEIVLKLVRTTHTRKDLDRVQKTRSQRRSRRTRRTITTTNTANRSQTGFTGGSATMPK
ncbi:hypothetical protein NUSPORA_00977 [Nucleospora cyclopteri]